MPELKLTEAQLVELARIGEIIRDQGVSAAEKELEKILPTIEMPKMKSREVTCNTCGYCAVCGPTPAAWVGVDMAVNVVGW